MPAITNHKSQVQHPPVPTVTKEMYEEAINKLVRLSFCSDKLLVLTEESQQLTNNMLIAQAKSQAVITLWQMQHKENGNHV